MLVVQDTQLCAIRLELFLAILAGYGTNLT